MTTRELFEAVCGAPPKGVALNNGMGYVDILGREVGNYYQWCWIGFQAGYKAAKESKDA